jgi:spermidine synthase
MSAGLLYLLFFFSGISGLVYQVVWVRGFGLVFGNTAYSSASVIAIFMLGLGVGSYVFGRWADRRYAQAPDSLLSIYAYVELAIAALGVAVSLALPHLTALSALTSSYVADASGWFVLSSSSYVARAAIAIVLLTPITALMGGTLTLLIRYRVRQDLERTAGSTIAALYGINTLGAAAGAWLTDFILVPTAGLLATQLVAVALNVIAGVGVLLLRRPDTARAAVPDKSRVREPRRASSTRARPALVACALALVGFAGLGMEILWLRHFTLLLGGFRAVFSLALTVILLGIGAGSLLGGWIDRRVARALSGPRTSRPAEALMVVEGLFIASALAGLASPNLAAVGAEGQMLETALATLTPVQRWFTELWFNARPVLLETALPSLLMGSTFPLANAIVQQADASVGRHAGLLYLANTAGAVCGSVVAGFVLLPAFGIQTSATLLMIAAAAAIAVLSMVRAERPPKSGSHERRPTDVASVPPNMRGGRLQAARGIAASISILAIGAWALLPSDYILRRSTTPLDPTERALTVSEGINEIITVTELAGRGRGLITNNHPMASTALLDQRYMRALAHIPLLSMERRARVLVIGFGVGNSTHAASLHPSVDRIEVVDLSRHVLEQANYFRDANHGVLADRRVSVYVNDGRQHLQIQPEGAYDLITLEPPPIAHAGVAALYSREFYQLARSRLTPGGYLSQWFPAYQVPAETSLAMVRAFLDAFPRAVLLSGMREELLLLGTTAPRMEIDPDRIARALERAPVVREDLRRIDLDTVTRIVGTFVASSEALVRATATLPAATDDRPLQEYGVRSTLGTAVQGVPASLFDVRAAASWCPRCFTADGAAPAAAGLDVYLTLLDEAYRSPATSDATRVFGQRRVLGSAYLGAVLPDTAEIDRNIGLALADTDDRAEAVDYLRRAIRINPDDAAAQHALGSLLLEYGNAPEAADHLRAALRARPDSAAAHNDLGVALGSMGQTREAIEHFRAAVDLEPDFSEARRNLEAALRAQR